VVTELFDAVTSWQTLLTVILVFGFAPGFLLRLLLSIYPRNHPRRRELVAQLYTLHRIERPFFVAEQLETVLFEGVPGRAAVVWKWLKQRTFAPLLYWWDLCRFRWLVRRAERLSLSGSYPRAITSLVISIQLWQAGGNSMHWWI
jgi:hypothetical protein